MSITIKNFKQKMTEKAIKKGGTWENFGQKELRKIVDAMSSEEQKQNRIQISELNDWASNFTIFS